MVAARQKNDSWKPKDPHYADRFTSPERKRSVERARKFNPYSYFQ
jgi:hypothetical protein